jgi:radical SAM-linked protein
VNVSVSTFVPKPHTPFQWEPQVSPAELEERQHFLKAELRGRGLRLKWHDARMSFLEGVFARGDRRLAEVLVQAHARGCTFDGWTEHLQWQAWQEAFAAAGIDPIFYACRRREASERLPWAHLRTGVIDAFLQDERTRAEQGVSTPDCRDGACGNCGACDKQRAMILADASSFPPPAVSVREVTHKRAWVRKLRSHFIKVGGARFLGHLEMVDVFVRAARRAGIPMQFSEGFHPLPRISFTNPLPVGMESLAEFMDLELVHAVKAKEFQERMNKELPDGLRIIRAAEMTVKGRSLPTMFTADCFLISLEGLDKGYTEEELIERLRQAQKEGECILVQEKKTGEKRMDVLQCIEKLRVVKPASYSPVLVGENGMPIVTDLYSADYLIEMGLKKTGGLRPAAVLKLLLGLTPEEMALLRVLKTESFPSLT